ncbi:MAG: hydrolase [Sphingobacteriales bacterium]|nr:hydrolase [Sphingobacteriales bacterium]
MKQSAGILLFKRHNRELLVLLAHPGGPFWKNKDLGSWSIPKGEFTAEEEPFDAAVREFEEETGVKLKSDFIELTPIKLKSNKVVFAWACEQDLNVSLMVSNEFEMEWPPKSGTLKRFPEIDKAAWFSVEEALIKINPPQADLIIQLIAKV